MKTKARRSKSARKARSASKAALGRYLAAGLGATGLASVECEAAVVNIDVSSRSGINGGLADGTQGTLLLNFPVAGIGLNVLNNFDSFPALDRFGISRIGSTSQILTTSNYGASPRNFASGEQVSGSLTWLSNFSTSSLFSYFDTGNLYESPNFGPGSYIGFRVRETSTATDWYYGYLEVTWNNTTNQFQILSGAYENVANAPIAVPEPTGVALAGIGALALGAGAIRRSRKARKAAAEAALAEAV